MKEWFFENILAFKPEVGFETKFNVKSEDTEFMHKWKVTHVVPFKSITFNWKYENYSGDSFVVFELIQQNDTTILKLTVNVVADFPDEIPEFRRESCVEGWKYFINGRLQNYLEGRME